MSGAKRVLIASHSIGGWNHIITAYLRCYVNQKVLFKSAVREPHLTNEWAIKVMAEDNIDISNYQQVLFSDLTNEVFDYALVIKQEGEQSPPLPEHTRIVKKIQIAVASISELDQDQMLLFYRDARERIKKRVLKFIGQELMSSAEE
jgi:protein-tyrosine-phosphatase